MIVDDDHSILSLLEIIFKNKYEVDVASNGKEALSKLTKNFYNLVITDCDMPVMNGLELFKQASRIIKGANKKFIFNTGMVTAEREHYFKQNDIKYITKPYSLQEIRDLVDNSIHVHG